jgi:iron(III) transport system substrate-binding protein
MWKNLLILALLALIIALPFALRPRAEVGAWKSGDPVLTIVTPHNEGIRHEFGRAFSDWHYKKYGKPVRIEWQAIGGTTEITRYLTSEYASAMRGYWTRELKKPWPVGASEAVTGTAEPADPALAEIWHKLRATDDASLVTSRSDIFFGGGEFDHSDAHRRGLTVAPWSKGHEPKHLFTTDDGTALIPTSLSGETWRTDALFGNVISTFGICFNYDRLRELNAPGEPTSWEDLADPRYFHQVGVADPDKSGSVAKAFEMIIHQRMHQSVARAGFSPQQVADFEKQIDAFKKERGKDYKRGDIPTTVPPAYQQAVEDGWVDGIRLVQRIGANARYFTDSASKVPIDISMGDAAIGMCIDFYGRYQAQLSKGTDGKPHMGYLTPIGGSSVTCDPISLLRGAGGQATTPEQRKELRTIAVRFIEFTLSEDGQRLWTYKAGTPGGPHQYTLRRLPVRRDFYPSSRPAIQSTHERHLKHAADNLADASVDPYKLADQFTYHKRWTNEHFSIHRKLIKAMCIDAGEELKDTWESIIKRGGPAKQPRAMEQLSRLPEVDLYDKKADRTDRVPLTWRTAPDIGRKYDALDFMREWTEFYRASYRNAAGAIE